MTALLACLLAAASVAMLLSPAATARRRLARLAPQGSSGARSRVPGARRAPGVGEPDRVAQPSGFGMPVRLHVAREAMARASPVDALAIAGVLAAAASLVGLRAGPGAWMSLALLAGALVRGRRRAARARSAAARRRAVLEACEVLDAELMAARTPRDALAAAAAVAPATLEPAVRLLDMGGSPAGYLVATSTQAGCEALLPVGVAWQVAAASGAPLSQLVRGVAAGLRAEHAISAEVSAQLAPVRATAKLLAGLPVVAGLLGGGLGASPSFLVQSAVGQACLLGASVLTVIGLGWLGLLVRSVDPAGR